MLKETSTRLSHVNPDTSGTIIFKSSSEIKHPAKYAELLGAKIKSGNVNVWLVNTGWTGGCYGVGERIKLKYTRALITAALNGKLNDVSYQTLPVFNLQHPTACPDVPAEMLNPKNTWADKNAFTDTLNKLATQFVNNFNQYSQGTNAEILDAAPKVSVTA